MKRTYQVPALVLAIALSGVSAWAQNKPENPTPTAAPQTGDQLFRTFCAVCHGTNAKGNGPATVALKTAPPDLTLLSRKNGGKFPLMKVTQVIRGDEVIFSHGTREMPIYGDMFRDIRQDEAFVKLRVGVLTSYIQSLQQK